MDNSKQKKKKLTPNYSYRKTKKLKKIAYNQEIANRIKSLQRNSNRTDEEMAVIMGLNLSTYKNYVRKIIPKTISYVALTNLCDKFSVTENFLLYGEPIDKELQSPIYFYGSEVVIDINKKIKDLDNETIDNLFFFFYVLPESDQKKLLDSFNTLFNLYRYRVPANNVGWDPVFRTKEQIDALHRFNFDNGYYVDTRIKSDKYKQNKEYKNAMVNLLELLSPGYLLDNELKSDNRTLLCKIIYIHENYFALPPELNSVIEEIKEIIRTDIRALTNRSQELIRSYLDKVSQS